MKILLTLICLMQMCIITWTLTAICDYKTENYVILQDKFTCEVKKDFEIVSKNSTLISNVVNYHKNEKTFNNVAVFKVSNFNVNFFPTGLEKYFINLEGIAIYSCGLKEVHQNNLKAFTNLTYLDLSDNDIEVIEAEIFKFNQNLRLIWIIRNKISHIDSNAFHGLSKLTNLNLRGNNCTDLKGTNANVKSVIEQLNYTCISQMYLEKKCNESISEKIEEIKSKNESAVYNADSQAADNQNLLLSMIQNLINEKFNENFKKTQELFKNLADKVIKMEQELMDTKSQINYIFKANLQTANQTFSMINAIQESQLQLMSHLHSKFESQSNQLEDGLKVILKSQNNNSCSRENKHPEAKLAQNLTAITGDLEEVKKSLSSTQSYVAVTIQTNAENTTLELQKIKEDIKVTEKKITEGIQEELKELRSGLEDLKEESKKDLNLTILTTVSTTTEENMKDGEEIEGTTKVLKEITSDKEENSTKLQENIEESMMHLKVENNTLNATKMEDETLNSNSNISSSIDLKNQDSSTQPTNNQEPLIQEFTNRTDEISETTIKVPNDLSSQELNDLALHNSNNTDDESTFQDNSAVQIDKNSIVQSVIDEKDTIEPKNNDTGLLIAKLEDHDQNTTIKSEDNVIGATIIPTMLNDSDVTSSTPDSAGISNSPIQVQDNSSNTTEILSNQTTVKDDINEDETAKEEGNIEDKTNQQETNTDGATTQREAITESTLKFEEKTPQNINDNEV